MMRQTSNINIMEEDEPKKTGLMILPERVFVVGNQKRTVKQHERSRSFSKNGQQGLGKKQRQMENPVLPLKQGRAGFFLTFLKIL